MKEDPRRADYQKRIARGENPYAAFARPLEGGSVDIRPGFITQQFTDLRNFLSTNVFPDLEKLISNLQDTVQVGIPCNVGEYESVDVSVQSPTPRITESGSLDLFLRQKNGIRNVIQFRPYRLEKYLSVDVSTHFGNGKRESGPYVSLSTHGRGYPYREQMIIGATVDAFSGKGRMLIVPEYDVNQYGNAPASSIEMRFYDDSDPSSLPDHRIATYRRIRSLKYGDGVSYGERFVLDERGHFLEGVRKMGVQLPREVSFDRTGQIVLGIPTQLGNAEAIEVMRIAFPERLSPGSYLEAVKGGIVDDSILGGFKIS